MMLIGGHAVTSVKSWESSGGWEPQPGVRKVMFGDTSFTESTRVTVVIGSSTAWSVNWALAVPKATSDPRTATNPAQRFFMFDPLPQMGMNQGLILTPRISTYGFTSTAVARYSAAASRQK
jgi:hypothetical protein